MSVGDQLKKFRKLNGLTQVKLSEKAGISRSYLADVEADRYNPSLSTLMDLAQALGITASCLLDDKEIDFHNLLLLCKKNGISLRSLCESLGIPADSLECIRTNNIPDEDTMFKICDYFDCTWDYLIGKTDSPDNIIFGDKSISIPSPVPGSPLENIVRVPIIETVAAGIPIYAEQNILGYEEVPKNFVNGREFFFLIVSGDSMTGSRIYSGDKVLIRSQSTVEDGDIALVLVNGDAATLRRVKYVNETAILYPDNPSYKPIPYPAGDVQIIGYVEQVVFSPNSKKAPNKF